MSDYLRRSTPEQLKADISSVLDVACYTGVETAEDVCNLLQSAINQVRQDAEWAEGVQSRRKGDPGTGLVAEIRYIPEAEVSRYAQPDTLLEEVPGFCLAGRRVLEEEFREIIRKASREAIDDIQRVARQRRNEKSL